VSPTEGETELVAGRYRILRELARGGVGAVYEAIDESTGRRVALKRLLPTAANRPRLALLFEAEYDTLARLRHPHIVEVYDYGIDKHGPYFTMELLDGKDLSELEPVPYRDACRYLRDVASSLALLHTRRRLHRDLSPRNVRLTSSGRCRLIDFGTMANFGVAKDIVGTPPMVPPEALRGTALDHRADLYSLGALAYRILSRRYAYRAHQLEDLPKLWRTPPARLRELVPEVPAELEDLVMSMLSLDPTYRPNTTYEVIDRLTAIGGLPPDTEQSRTAQGYLVGSRLVGRSSQMDSIQRRIARAHEGRGGVIVIEGNPGVGKSRLLDEAALAAQLSGALTVRVDARAHPGAYGVSNAIAKAILEAAPHDARKRAEPYAANLRVFDVFDPEGTSKRRHAARENIATRLQLHNAVLSWLFDLAGDRTLALLVDDLPRIDERSAALLHALTDNLAQKRILLIAARRLAEKHAPPEGVDAIVVRARRLRLHRLRREETAAVLASLFGTVPNLDVLADWIHEATTGTPMQLMELAKHLVRENNVRFVDGLWVIPPHLSPDRLQRNLAATLSARAAALPPPERRLAEALSVRRGNLSLPLCMRLADEDDAPLLFENLDELVAKGVLSSGVNGYHFGQDALRQVLLRQLPDKRAKRLHLRLGKALLQQAASEPQERIEGGYNLILGGDELHGAKVVAVTARRLPTRSLGTTQALPAVEAALEVFERLGRPRLDCLRLRVVLAGAMDRRATQRYATATLQALCDAAGGQGQKSYTLLRCKFGSQLEFWTRYTATQLEFCMTPAQQRGPRPGWALAMFYRVGFSVLGVFMSELDVEGTKRLVRQAQSLAPAGPLHALVAEVFRAQLLALRGNVAASLSCARTVHAQFEAVASEAEQGTRSGIVATLNIGMGMLEAHYGLRSQAALSVCDELTELADQVHAQEPVGAWNETGAVSELELRLAAHELTQAVHLARAECSQAEAEEQPAPKTGPTTGLHRQLDVWTTLIECDIGLRTGDVAGLRRCVETFTHWVAENSGLAPWLDIARAHLALCLGKPKEALVGYGRWVRKIRPGDALCWDTLYFGYAEGLLAVGESSRARAWLMDALKHPVVKDARETTSGATLSALLALVEAECKALDLASERIQMLEQALADSDHPLVLGYVHEVAARIAHKRGDEKTCSEQLSQMKRWYTLTRNSALLTRGQRVQDSLSDMRLGEVSTQDAKKLKKDVKPAEDNDADRPVVTRVTTRRDPASGKPSSGPIRMQWTSPEHTQALQTLLSTSGANDGYLYVLHHDHPRLVAATRNEHANTLAAKLSALIEQFTEAVRAEAPDASEPPATANGIDIQTADANYQLHWLSDPETGRVIAACFLRREDRELRALEPELLERTASTLPPPPLSEPSSSV